MVEKSALMREAERQGASDGHHGYPRDPGDFARYPRLHRAYDVAYDGAREARPSVVPQDDAADQGPVGPGI